VALWSIGIALVIVCTTRIIMLGGETAVALMLGVSTLAGVAYLGANPILCRILLRMHDEMMTDRRPEPAIWARFHYLQVFEAACLLADVEPRVIAVRQPGPAKEWYDVLVNSIIARELRLPPELRENNINHVDESTVITKRALQTFAADRGVICASLEAHAERPGSD